MSTFGDDVIGGSHSAGGGALGAMPGSAVRVVRGDDTAAGAVRGPKPPAKRRQFSLDELVQGVLACDPVILPRAITIVESSAPAHRDLSRSLVEALLPKSGRAIRVGITGVPGVGKSTFIEALGCHLVEERGHRVAVLAVDPSSNVSGGSILGDKTRMERFSRLPGALVRPSPCSGWLGGVARGTREAMLLCEAAGFDVLIVETVGVGQSEIVVSSMVDTFLLLMLAGAGDELQGIKRGIVEMADIMAITKADGENVQAATRARAEYRGALRLIRPLVDDWHPPVLACSALTGSGIADVWEAVVRHRQCLEAGKSLAEKRQRQSLFWMDQTMEQLVIERLRNDPAVVDAMPAIKAAVLAHTLTPTAAAEHLLALHRKSEGA